MGKKTRLWVLFLAGVLGDCWSVHAVDQLAEFQQAILNRIEFIRETNRKKFADWYESQRGRAGLNSPSDPMPSDFEQMREYYGWEPTYHLFKRKTNDQVICLTNDYFFTMPDIETQVIKEDPSFFWSKAAWVSGGVVGLAGFLLTMRNHFQLPQENAEFVQCSSAAAGAFVGVKAGRLIDYRYKLKKLPQPVQFYIKKWGWVAGQVEFALRKNLDSALIIAVKGNGVLQKELVPDRKKELTEVPFEVEPSHLPLIVLREGNNIVTYIAITCKTHASGQYACSSRQKKITVAAQ